MDFHSSIVCLLLLISIDHVLVNSDEKNTTFQPTKDWQKIEDGQSIPPGLHVRINLQTGYKEAKLPDEESDKNSLITLGDGENEGVSGSALNHDELKRIMKNIKSNEPAPDSSEPGKFRSYDELKQDFVELNLQVKTDIEIITNLVENFKKFHVVRAGNHDTHSAEAEDEEILLTLVDLEYLVHQFDNAKEFAKLNGFPDVIHKSLNSTNSEIRSEALRLHGSATQSNPKVQIAALDSGTINLLLKILTFDDDLNVRSRSLYALSCLLRKFPAAQHKLLSDGGLTVFAAVFDEDKQDLLKLQIKIITLIHDLLFERKDTKMNILEEESKNETNSQLLDLKERLRQYQKIDIEKKLVEQNWCSRISNWFIKQNFISGFQNSEKDGSVQSPNSDHHDMIEKVVDTLYILSDICRPQFQNEKELIEVLFNLKDIYDELALSEVDDTDDSSTNFYSSLSNILKILTEKLKVQIPPKEEL